jgi:WXG100 family type VII secretion target
VANVNVTYQEMEQMARRLTAAEGQMTADLSSLQKLVDQLVSSGFVTDAASPAFHGAYTQFTNGAKQMLQGLSGMGRFLTAAHQGLQQTDQQLAKAIGRG